jgi:hypothetical protein
VSKLVNEAIQSDSEWETRVEEGRRISSDEIKASLARVPDVPPLPGDELPEGFDRNR